MEQQTTITNSQTIVGRHNGPPLGNVTQPEPRTKVQEPTYVTMSLHPGKVAIALCSITAVLAAADVAVLSADYYTGYSSVVIHKLVKLFDLGLEVNVPAYFSVTLLFSAAVLVGLITLITKKQKGSHVIEWAILTFGFLFMGFDELASAHERLIEPTRALLGIETPGLLYFAWVVPAIVLVAVIGTGFVKFLVDLPPRTRTAFMIAGSMYLGGAIGLELFEGACTVGSLAYNTLVVFEESLEMAGVIVFVWALLDYLTTNFKANGVKFDIATPSGPQDKKWAISDLGLQS
ncbi:MAG: hypothetical protein WBO68_05945 [Pyrinomonadaceae bacterium]